MIEYKELQKILPHAYPFVLIDRVEEFTKGVSLVAVKNISCNEWVFQNPKQEIPYFPEVLIIEAAAQAALVLYRMSEGKSGEKSQFFLGKTKVEFMNTCTVGDQLRIKVIVGKIMRIGGFCRLNAYVGEVKIMDGEFIFKVS